MRHLLLAPLAAAILLSGCASKPEAPVKEGIRLNAVASGWSALPGWSRDDARAARPAIEKSCARLANLDPARMLGPDGIAGTAGDWQRACQQVLATDAAGFKAAVEMAFQPWAVSNLAGNRDGLFTGYYEPMLRGSRTRHGPYQTPLYGRPDDLVMVDLGAFRDELKGQRIAGRVVDGRLQPYEDRAAIVSGAMDQRSDSGAEVLVWVDDPVDAFFLQIQGSGRIQLETGEEIRLGYAGQNGHPYVAIGKVLIEMGEIDRKHVSLDSIRAWLASHPAEAAGIMNANPSYVFFTELEGEGPLGAEGVPLTPGRSLAVDRTLMPYGAPVFLDAEDPLTPGQRLQQLMVAQDTGGAIRGAVRGDVFWGHGHDAEQKAGHMKSKGRYWLLLPLGVTPPNS